MLSLLKNNKYRLLLCLVLILAGYGSYKYFTADRQEEAVKTAIVQQRDIVSSVAATGSLSAVNNVDISSKITGRIVEVYVKENQHVNAGDVLVKLDDTSLKATLKQMSAKLDYAAANYLRYSDLLKSGAVSQADYDSVYSEYLVAKSNYEKAASDVQDTIITTPIDGYVIGDPTPVGQTISSGISEPQVIMSIATLDDMQIETMVDESDIGKIKIGQQVKFTVDAYTDEVFTGKVRLISRAAEKENNVIYYKVYVNVDDARGKLLPTMTARTDIIVESADNVLTVPMNCVYREQAGSYVLVYDEKTKNSSKVPVEIILSDNSDIAVKSDALKAGDTVVARKAVARQVGVNARIPRI